MVVSALSASSEAFSANGGHRSPPVSCWVRCQESEVSIEKDKARETISNTVGSEQRVNGQKHLEEV